MVEEENDEIMGGYRRTSGDGRGFLPTGLADGSVVAEGSEPVGEDSPAIIFALPDLALLDDLGSVRQEIPLCYAGARNQTLKNILISD